ncbi:T9SS type A sorting domain-containing protein [Chryseobacterium taklimakanense]|uniref:T9SS C-terminal target domain-containing protein n=1 Tax=Chryseobacterium taklimakanense TaxID=536441 RepID=A0A3G8WXB4_9FLAO|nr:T9SS type A sorting domain-containing protein [Chryseobacterium taklimakanense]AZI20981.1 T9SS C-terminal target domain-containing protein [Chryseobacterium taklimakanense]
MKKTLLSVGLLALAINAKAQFLSSVGDGAVMHIGKDALVYNGGGMKIVGSGLVQNHGNVMLVGSSTDKFSTVTTSNVDKAEGSTVVNFINKINETGAYASVNTPANPSVYTYGQLYISGLTQGNITGIVDQEYRNVKHGDYQQLGVPFFNKTFSTFSTELGKTFVNSRRTKNEMLVWNNPKAEFDNVDVNSKTTSDATRYYSFGSLNLDTSSKVYTIKGRPYAEENTPAVTLVNGGASANFGDGGNNLNSYGGRYNSYLQDAFSVGFGEQPFTGNYGKNLYQFSNPFLTNLDLRNIAFTEPASTGDDNNLSNIYGIRLDVSGVQYNPNAGGGSTSIKFVTFVGAGTPSTPVGDVDYLIVRPMGTFVIKMKDNTVPQTLNFTKLRRFGYIPRSGSTNYTVSAAKITDPGTAVMRTAASKKTTSGTANSVKQLGVIGLDASGNEIARTYYVVYPNAVDGHPNTATAQVQSTVSELVTFEEDPTAGGYDNNYLGYSLYINEANETSFQGKPIPLAIYNPNIKKLKFEIRENAELLESPTSVLSSGISFYYKIDNGELITVTQGKEVAVSVPAGGADASLYYGAPTEGTLSTGKVKIPSKTRVVFNPHIDNYLIKFDPVWKKANIVIYDMSGKIVKSYNNVNATSDFIIDLPKGNMMYIVTAVADTGEKMNSKIIR